MLQFAFSCEHGCKPVASVLVLLPHHRYHSHVFRLRASILIISLCYKGIAYNEYGWNTAKRGGVDLKFKHTTEPHSLCSTSNRVAQSNVFQVSAGSLCNTVVYQTGIRLMRLPGIFGSATNSQFSRVECPTSSLMHLRQAFRLSRGKW